MHTRQDSVQPSPRCFRRAVLSAALGLLVPAFAGVVASAPAQGVTVPVMAAGGDHSCALAAGGSVWCWGHNGAGQLGVSGINESTAPVQVPGIPPAIGLATGSNHSCSIDTANNMWCWARTPLAS